MPTKYLKPRNDWYESRWAIASSASIFRNPTKPATKSSNKYAPLLVVNVVATISLLALYKTTVTLGIPNSLPS